MKPYQIQILKWIVFHIATFGGIAIFFYFAVKPGAEAMAMSLTIICGLISCSVIVNQLLNIEYLSRGVTVKWRTNCLGLSDVKWHKAEFHITPVLTWIIINHPSGCGKGRGIAIEWGHWAFSIYRSVLDKRKFAQTTYPVDSAIYKLRKAAKEFESAVKHDATITQAHSIEVGSLLDKINGSMETMFTQELNKK